VTGHERLRVVCTDSGAHKELLLARLSVFAHRGEVRIGRQGRRNYHTVDGHPRRHLVPGDVPSRRGDPRDSRRRPVPRRRHAVSAWTDPRLRGRWDCWEAGFAAPDREYLRDEPPPVGPALVFRA
jgi:hypothetical protein